MPKVVSRQMGEVLFIICYISHIRFRVRIGSGCAGSSGKLRFHFYLWINFLQGGNPTWVKILREVPIGTHLSWEHKTLLCLLLQNSNCLWMRRVLQRNIWGQVNWNVEVKSLEFSKEEARIPRRSYNDRTRWCLSCPGASEVPRERAWGGGLAKMQLLSDLKPVPEKLDAFTFLALLFHLFVVFPWHLITVFKASLSWDGACAVTRGYASGEAAKWA